MPKLTNHNLEVFIISTYSNHDSFNKSDLLLRETILRGGPEQIYHHKKGKTSMCKIIIIHLCIL